MKTAFLLLTAILLTAFGAFAESTIWGRVADPQGKAVPNATVKLDTAVGYRLLATADGEGRYQADPQEPQEDRAGQGGDGDVAQPLAVVVDLLRPQVDLEVADHVGEHEPQEHDAGDGHGPLLADRRLVQVERPRPLPPGRLHPAEGRAALILLHQIQGEPSRTTFSLAGLHRW